MTENSLAMEGRGPEGNPVRIDPALDKLGTPRNDIPDWNETLFLALWNPDEGVGVWMHAGVHQEDRDLWWVQTYALLPDGVVLADRSYARLRHGGGNLKVNVIEPLRRWHFEFDGAAEVTSTAELAKDGLTLGIATSLRFDITFNAVTPLYDMYAALGQGAHMVGDASHSQRLHHEQGGTAVGTMTALGETWQLDGPVVRDHSRGVRDLSAYAGHVWNYAVWPEQRRGLSFLSVWTPPERTVALSAVMISEGDHTETSRDFQLRSTNVIDGVPRDFTLDIIRADGSRLALTGRVVHNVTVTYAPPNHNFIGNYSDERFGITDAFIANESITEWTWPDGTKGFGHVERARAGTEAPDAAMPLPADSPFAASATVK